MTVHIDLPGSDTYITFKEQCLDCGHEFDLVGRFEDSDDAVCPLCRSLNIHEKYLLFPDNGPGFQNDYGTQSDRLRGGSCGGSCE